MNAALLGLSEGAMTTLVVAVVLVVFVLLSTLMLLA